MALTGNMSQYLQNAVLNWHKGTTFSAAPANTYVALLTTAPTDSSGAGSVEVSGGSYARVAIASSGWSTISGSPSSPGQISNSGTLTFATPTANWGTVLCVATYDASTAGNLLWFATITSQIINTGAVASFSIGSLVLTLD